MSSDDISQEVDQFSIEMMEDSMEGASSPFHDSELTRSLLSPVYAPSDNAEETISEVESISEMLGGDFSESLSIPVSRTPRNSEKHAAVNILTTPTRSARSIFNKENSKSIDDSEPIHEANSMELETKTRLKIKIKRLKITGEWKWTAGRGDTCGICRTAFESACVECSVPGDDCPLVIGVCRHPFHMHCIYKWTNGNGGNQTSACPLCRQDWIIAS